MALALKGAINSVAVNSEYPVNGSLLLVPPFPGDGAGEELCVPAETRFMSVAAELISTVLAEVRMMSVAPENRDKSLEAEPMLVQPEDRSVSVKSENRNMDAGTRGTCK